MTTFLNLLNFFLSNIDSFFRSSPIVLTYHSVSDGKTPISVTVDNFRRQMTFLKESGTNIITLQNFLNFKDNKLKLSGRNILITFDDAFKDVFFNALPILKELGFPAAIFVNPSLLGGRAEFATRAEDKDRLICSISDLQQLEKSSVAIANHGYSHKQLSGLSEAEITFEYEKAFTWIEDNFKTNSYPNVFVFPQGAKNQQVKLLLKNMGARILDDRIDIYSDTTLFKFILKLSRAYLWLRKRIFLIK